MGLGQLCEKVMRFVIDLYGNGKSQEEIRQSIVERFEFIVIFGSTRVGYAPGGRCCPVGSRGTRLGLALAAFFGRQVNRQTPSRWGQPVPAPILEEPPKHH